MSRETLTQFAIDNTDLILKSFKANEITFIKNLLYTTKEQILAKYGKFQLNDEGLDLYTKEQIIQRMPNETRVMFFSINNASFLIELSLRLNEDLQEDVKRMRGELTNQQIIILELQNQLNKLNKE